MESLTEWATENKLGENTEDNSPVETNRKTATATEDSSAKTLVENNAKDEAGLSKRQKRRLKKREIWLANLPAKRAKEKMRKKLKRLDAKINNLPISPTRQQLKNVKMANSECKVNVALDFSFDELMTDKDICKTINQTHRCYGFNRRAKNPLQFSFVNLNGKSRQEMSKHTGYMNWDVNIHSKTYLELFPKDSIVYLTSDSHNVVETFDPAKFYIIGALVDHNSQKGLCHNVATTQGIGHARLPIEEYLKMSSRKVLAINHVFQIIVEVCNGMPWEEAFLKIIPQRKGAVSKDAQLSDETDDG